MKENRIICEKELLDETANCNCAKCSLKTIELFSGTKSFSRIMEKHGHETFTIDNDPKLGSDVVCDILEYGRNVVDFCVPDYDILWASPPCTTFSVASISHYWENGKPKNDKALHGIKILDHTIFLISRIKPKYWFIENPRGMMRKVIDEIFEKYGVKAIRHTVSYCQYGSKIMKPTDIWTNAEWWVSRPMCKNGAPCHERAGRGSKTGVQGIYNLEWEKARGNSATARGVIPPALFEEILKQMPK